MPRTKKPAGAAADPRNGRRTELAAVGNAHLERFDPPADICSDARAQWDSYWLDSVSQAPTQADRGLLTRWITSYDRYLKTIRLADENPISEGSTGQAKPSPFYTIAKDALAVVEACEQQLGIGAKNRAALGLAIVAERKSLSDLNRQYQEASRDDRDEAKSEDPRLAVVKTEAISSRRLS